jgi:hypothetical protein
MPGTEAVMDTDRGDRESASRTRGSAGPGPPRESPATAGPPWAVSEPSASRAASARPQQRPVSLRDRDESDPERRAVELAQRGRIILDVSIADLEAAEAVHGAFHPIAWHFRNACNEARRSWERLRAELGTKALEAALDRPPLVILPLGEDKDGSGPGSGLPRAVLIVIAGRTYCLQRIAGTELAPVQWRLTRPHPPLEDGPYYACRLADGSTQCDCAEWTYQIADDGDPRQAHCKHLAALAALGWV